MNGDPGRRGSAGGRIGTLLRVAAVVLTLGVGALFAVGAVLGILFEVQGFGTPPGGPRRGYIAAQAGQLLASLAVAVLVLRIALPGFARWWLALLGLAIALAVVVGLLGLSAAA